MDPGDTSDLASTEELRRVEAEVHSLSGSVRRLDGDLEDVRQHLSRLEDSLGKLETHVADTGDEVRALRVEERERADEQRAERRWRQALVERITAGTYALAELALSRATDAAVLTRVAVIVALLVAALYGVTLAYDGTGWTIGTGTAAERGAQNRALPDVRESDQVPDRYPVEPSAPQPTM